MGWTRKEQPDLAAARILDAAEKAFIEKGVSAAGMAEIAEAAGCSRGTLYRYFPNRHELHLAYVEREALSIARRVRDATAQIEDAQERLVEYVLGALHEVRANPGTAAWFTPAASGMAARMSRSSEVIRSFTTGFVARMLGPDSEDPEVALRARWLERIILSLLAVPGASPAEEREMIERFVAPAVLAD